MAYYRKNKRRFDPRYFMNERMEQIDEMIPGDDGLNRGKVGDDDGRAPETIRQRIERARKESGPEALEDYEGSVEDQLANLADAHGEQEEINALNRKFDAAGAKNEGFGDAEEPPLEE